MPADTGFALFHRASHNPSFEQIRAATHFQGELTDFCVPVNLHFPPPELAEMVRDGLADILKYYPDEAAVHQGHIADLVGVPAANIVAANGSTEIITTLCRAARGPLLTSVPTFGRWTDLPRDFGVPVSFLERRKQDGFRLSPERIVGEVRRQGARTVVISNPNNPTGAILGPDEIEFILAELADLDAVIIDESFIDFSGQPSAAPLAVRSPNALVVKSMGKALGWHGIRLGYAVAREDTAERLRMQIPWWNINGLAAFVLRHLGQFRAAYDNSFASVMQDREDMLARLRQVKGLHPYPSAANFLYCELADGVSGRVLRDRLLQHHGLIVRECSNKVGSTESFLRLAVQGRAALDRLAAGMEQELPTLVGARA